MTALAVSAAVCGFAGYFIRRSAKPRQTSREGLSTLLNALALILAAIYFYLRLTAS